MKFDCLPIYENIYMYMGKIRPIHSQKDVKVVMYFKPVKSAENEHGFVTEYEILKITDIENYLLGDVDKTCYKHIYKSADVPGEIKIVFKGLSMHNH